jgi:large repetitive protein
MGSNKGNGRGQGPDRRRGGGSPRRRGAEGQKRRGFPRIESLEDRTLLDANTSSIIWHPTDTNTADVKNGPLANSGQLLVNLYQAFQQNSDSGQLAKQFPLMYIGNGEIGVDIKGTGDLTSFVQSLTNLGMQVTATDATREIVEGVIPISNLVSVATAAQTVNLNPILKPKTSAATFQGVADNEANENLQAPQARGLYGVDGTGVTVGVLSDSVSQVGNGLADSVATGDLPPNVNVLQDDLPPPIGGAPGTDEGRAMLENIHDIAPGASLAFASADNGEVSFAQNIGKLAAAGAKVIVDDILYFDEPMFQDGIVAQAVNNVANNGVVYLSAAGNNGPTGYMSQFRGVNATVGNIDTVFPGGQDRYMNFDPGGGTTTLLPFTTGPFVNGGMAFEYDQPYYTTSGVTSDLDIYILDSTGKVVAYSNSNNIASQTPFEFVDYQGALPGETALKPNTTYFIAVKVFSGADPKHIEFIDLSDGDYFDQISQQFGSAGGTTYPTTYGHSVAAGAIGVGAVPWWGTNPSDTPAPPPVFSEPFSSVGPAFIDIGPTGNPITPQVRQSPVISAFDGGNTSFFPQPIAQNLLDTSNPGNPTFPGSATNPPVQGQPKTPTNLAQPNLPAFFGTSSAAPNAAAVVALMLQRDPTATPAEIRKDLIASAKTSPLNGSAPGAWDPKGGFGLINAPAALAALNVLSVTSTTTTVNGQSVTINGATLTQAPGAIIVTFNQPVNFATISAADLVFTGTPPGVGAGVSGAPIAIDNPLFPTQVAFPIALFLTQAGASTNGTYSFQVRGPIVSQSGLALVPSAPVSFNLNDTTAPVVTNTTINGRVITITFNEGLDPATVNFNTIIVLRAGGVNQPFGGPTNVDLTADPRARIKYNIVTDPTTLVTTYSVTVDLSGIPQSDMPTDRYLVAVLAGNDGTPGVIGPGVTDVAGNFLDGRFATPGVFPTGLPGVPRGPDERFLDDLGVLTLTPPQVTSLSLSPQSDTGIAGDGNTNTNTPTLVGQVASPFPGTVAGLTVVAEFSGLHGGATTLGTGSGGRGFSGPFDVATTTDANGAFVIQAPPLPEGFQTVRVVVVGQPDSPPLDGLSTAFDSAFRVDLSAPQIIQATATPAPGAATNPAPLPLSGSNLSSLNSLSFDVLDPSNPTSGPLATPAQLLLPALDPATAGNVGNYTLLNLDTNTDESSFISSATFVATAADFITTPASRANAAAPAAGRIDLTFAPGLPSGRYTLIAHTAEAVPVAAGGAPVAFQGLRDASGNPLNNTAATGGADFSISFTVQPQPTFITSLNLENNAGAAIGGPRSFFELPPGTGTNTRDNVAAPPTTFVIGFSNALPATVDYTNLVQLIRSANSAAGAADGDFGTLGVGGLGSGGSGFTRVAGTTVTLFDQAGHAAGSPGFDPLTAKTLVLKIAPGTVLPADDYRIYIPNAGTTALTDVFGNQLDGEFLADQTAAGFFEDQLPDGSLRFGLSGDGVAGGAFMTAFTVVPYGNVVYAKPDYVENPLIASTAPDGSLAKPYSTLAPEANPATAPANPTNDPNGGLNATSNFFSFNASYDFNGNGHFDRSALAAAQALSANGPVVVVALPATPQRNPNTGVVTQQSFVDKSTRAANGVATDGSISVPFNTTLVFSAGSSLKMQGTSIYVQNQGSAIQALGGASTNQSVTFTSLNNNAVGGASPGSSGSVAAGDWGSITLRNFNDLGDATHARGLAFPIDGVLKGPGGTPAISGAQDAMSILNFANISFAGGGTPSVPQGADAIELFNSRPAITNTTISNTGGAATGGASLQAGIAGDLDSFREDDTARGVLVRRVSVTNNSLNGILIRSDSLGVSQATDALLYPNNPLSLGGAQNYTLSAPLPYILTSLLQIGTQVLVDGGVTPGTTTPVLNRLYVQPGTMVKFQRGAGIEVVTPGASLNVGDRNYINGFDSLATMQAEPLPDSGFNFGVGGNFFSTINMPSSTYGPNTPGFKAEATDDPQVVFTSLYDDLASTPLVPAINSANTTTTNNNGLPTTPGVAVPPLLQWGSISYDSGAYGVINRAKFTYGGGTTNLPGGTVNRDVLSFLGASGVFNFSTPTPIQPGATVPTTAPNGFGTRVMVTNNVFQFNGIINPNNANDYSANPPNGPLATAAIQITPDGLLAADPLRPLASGNPFFRNNVLTDNGLNGMEVLTSTPVDAVHGAPDLDVNSVWDDTDITYLLRGTVRPSNDPFLRGTNIGLGTTAPPQGPEIKPWITLTLQSATPGTLLANGTSIANPGESLMVKGLTGNNDPVAPTDVGAAPSPWRGGAGFAFGVDDGIDPPATSATIDQGLDSQLRILGIGADPATGQARVPVIFTSFYDSSYPRTINGVDQSSVVDFPAGATPTTPKAGDAGVVFIGGYTLPTYNAFDLREGSRIDNADISYITRIEVQGGGNVTGGGILGAGGSFDDLKNGVLPPQANGQPNPNNGAIQYNANKEVTISNSNLLDFSDSGVVSQVGFNLVVDGGRVTQPTTIQGEPVLLLMYNDTIANMANTGVTIRSATVDDTHFPDPMEFLALNNTFYNNPIAVFLDSVQHTNNPDNIRSSNQFIGMDNIFVGSTTAAVMNDGMVLGSDLQYNLFFNNAAETVGNSIIGPPLPAVSNNQPIHGDPKFVNPTAQYPNKPDFRLQAGSAAIDAARSELSIDPNVNGGIFTSLVPIANQVLDALGTGGIRNANSRNPGGFFLTGFNLPPTTTLTLPGYTARGFVDQWEMVTNPSLATGSGTSAVAYNGPSSNSATNDFVPFVGGGQRDQSGSLRQDNLGTRNVGFGDSPYFDVGAFEFVQFNPPEVTAFANGQNVIATLSNGTARDIYSVGGTAGTNSSPTTIQFHFNHALDPATITNQSVTLQQSDPSGNFGTAGSRTINLAPGQLSYDSTNNILTVSLAGLSLPSALYRLTLAGSGANVIRDLQGNALDGENTTPKATDSPTNPQAALPSGDTIPGGNFYLTFSINTNTPSVTTGTLRLDPTSDTGVAGDNTTDNNTPTFIGSVSYAVPSPLNPVAGNTVLLYVGGVLVGTGLTDAAGNFTVTVGQDGAGTGGVKVSSLADTPYDVGPDGILNTSDDAGHDTAVAVVVDANGNASVVGAPGSTVRFVVDTKGPQVTGISPASGSLLTANAAGNVDFSFTTDENINPASLTPASIQVVRAGPDGVFGTGDDVAVPVPASSIFVAPMPGAGPKGPERVGFSLPGPLVNDQYLVVLRGTGASPIADIAGNPLNGTGGAGGADLSFLYLSFTAGVGRNIFVGPASSITNPTGAQGTVGNPFPTIAQGLAAARTGDVVAVLPGVYNENVTLKQYVRLVSADPTSTDTTVVAGDPLQTIIRAPAGSTAPTVLASGISSNPGLLTEISGFTISNALLGDPAAGFINPNSIGIATNNASVLIDGNYVVDSGTGVLVVTTGAGSLTPQIVNDVVVGNAVGITVSDSGNTTSLASPTMISNDDVAFNTIGFNLFAVPSAPVMAEINNTIFWENNDRSSARNGAAIQAQVPNKIQLNSNLFSGNGPSEANPADDTIGVGGGFDPSLLGATPDATGNLTGAPAFVSPRDPRPGFDGPAAFFLDTNFDLTGGSAAIDRSNPAFAPQTDFLGRSRMSFGRGIPGTPDVGPADIGAFEFQGTGGSAVGGAFRVVTTSLAPGGVTHAAGAAITSAPGSLVVDFSGKVDPATLAANDLVISGSAVNPVSPVKATSLQWLDSHTVMFLLSGQFNSTGTIDISISDPSIKSDQGASLPAYTDEAVLVNAPTPTPTPTPSPTPSPTPTPTPTPTPSPTPSPTPAPAPSPTPAPAKPPTRVVVPKHPAKVVVPKHPAKVVVPKRPVKAVVPKPTRAVSTVHKATVTPSRLLPRGPRKIA